MFEVINSKTGQKKTLNFLQLQKEVGTELDEALYGGIFLTHFVDVNGTRYIINEVDE